MEAEMKWEVDECSSSSPEQEISDEPLLLEVTTELQEDWPTSAHYRGSLCKQGSGNFEVDQQLMVKRKEPKEGKLTQSASSKSEDVQKTKIKEEEEEMSAPVHGLCRGDIVSEEDDKEADCVAMTAMAKKYTVTQELAVLNELSDNENGMEEEYPESDIESGSESEPDDHDTEEMRLTDCPTDSSSDDDSPASCPRPAKRRRTSEPDPLSQGWGQNFTPVDTGFDGPEPGPTSLCQHLSESSCTLDFANLFLTEYFWDELCLQTNKRAQQVRSSKPTYYYGRIWKDVTTEEMKAFIGLKLLMENVVVKPRLEDYWKSNNFTTSTPGIREVMERDRFLSIWAFLHYIDEKDPGIDKSDVLYKVRPLMDYFLALFKAHYNADQHLSLDLGMMPTKNRLAVKQCIKDTAVKWGCKSVMVTCPETGYIFNAHIYTGRRRKEYNDSLGEIGNVVVDLLKGCDIEDHNHIVMMDRFYTSVRLFHYLYTKMNILAVGTCMVNRSFYPPSLNKKTMKKRGAMEYKCRENITGVVWNDRRPINFLSSYHDPNDLGTVRRKNKDGTTVMVPCPQVVIDYSKYMGGCDKNDQVCRLNKTRQHLRRPRQLKVKFIFWALYNSYVIMDCYKPHKLPNKRPRTFYMFLESVCLDLIGDFRSSIEKRRSRGDTVERLRHPCVHVPERPAHATTNNICVVCSKKTAHWLKQNPGKKKSENPYKQSKTTFWCSRCQRFLCIRLGSTCWFDWHNKEEFWR